MKPYLRFNIVLFLLFALTKFLSAQSVDTTVSVNGWKVKSYSAEITTVKTYYDTASPYHGKYSQWFEVTRTKPDLAFYRQYTATFKKSLSKRIAKWDYSEIAINLAHTYPRVSTIIETPNLELAFGNNGSISNFQTIINTYNEKWISIALLNNFTSLDSIDCIYFKVGGNFLTTKFQVDFLRFGKNSAGTIVTTIEDFEDALITGIERDRDQLPNDFCLRQNYPNPFNPETTISYTIPKGEHVTLKVYDLLGREVATLVDEFKQAGTYNSQFSIRNSSPRSTRVGAGQLSSGAYFFQLRTDSFVETKKLMLMK
ncbi:MAG: T9SS type A sorting domain-containing protein [Ignavibacteriales bacterium]|nr:T9SS type A sorting domain-containing protein [Ignavibacteriales bacterium]